MRRPPRIAVLTAALAAVGAWIAVNPQRPADATPAAAPPRAAIVPALARLAEPEVARLPARESLEKLARDPFARPATPPRLPVALATPVAVAVIAPAPPFPFYFVGRVWLPSGTQVLLGRGDDAFVVREGDVLTEQYRVEKLGAADLVVVHLPTDTRTVIQFDVPEDAK